MELVREGRVWKFGDHINTDLIFPNVAFRLPEHEQHRTVFSANRAGWVDEVSEGDLVVAGQNFGMGSGRPVGRLLRECGIRGIVAESLNGLCLRNLIVAGLPAIECPGVTGLFSEGEIARVDFASGLVVNLTNGSNLQGKAMPGLLAETVRAGGVLEMLIREGYVEASKR